MEGGVGGEGSTVIVEVGEKMVAVVALWAGLGTVRLDIYIELSGSSKADWQ